MEEAPEISPTHPLVSMVQRNIPAEIWLEIASYIPNDVLQKLYAVNSLFQRLALDAQWKAITVSTSELNTSLSSYEPLLRISDPFLAKHVRKVTITDRRAVREVNKGYGYWRSERYISTRLPGYTATPSRGGAYSMCKVDMDRVKEIARTNVCCLPAVKELCIELWDPIKPYAKSYRMCPYTHATQLLMDSIPALGKSLRSLTLSGHPQGFETFLRRPSTPPCLPSLHQLRITLINRPDLDEEPMMNTLLPFVNASSQHLRDLHITFAQGCTLDISPFLRRLDKCVELKSFALHAPFHVAFQSDPPGSSLTEFFRNHSRTLRKISLRLHAEHWASPETDQDLDRWLSGSLCSDWMMYSHIQDLEISSTSSPEVFGAIVEYLRRSSGSLTSLSIRDVRYTLKEVEQLARVLPIERKDVQVMLSEVRLGVRLLSAGLLDLLAKKLPWLKKLHLDVENIGRERVKTVDECRLRDFFYADMRRRCYSEWRLNELNIMSLQAAEELKGVTKVLSDSLAGNAAVTVAEDVV